MDLEQLKHQFANPPSKFAFAPFWFLNHELTDEELRWQIREMNATGVRGFIMHARHGLITEYLSDEWFDRIGTCIEEADRLGMKAYLYDENNWPSGPVDGVLLERYPEYRMSGCSLSQRFQVSRGRSLKQNIAFRDGLIAVVAVPVEKDVLVGLPQSAVVLDGFVHEGVLEWQAPEDGSKWAVFVFTRTILRGATFFGGYLDTLNEDAVAKFIEMTHERYTQRFSNYYGGTVDGIFTDEPSMCYFGPDTVPFTPSLPSEFYWRHGCELFRVLPAVFEDAGDQTAQLRCDFYGTVTELYQRAFFKQLYDYCDSHRLNLLGHVMQEGELYESTRHQGDFFRGAEYMHLAGCDFLGELTWPRPNPPLPVNNLVGPKLASSAAHIFGKKRVGSECFGLAGGWHVDLRLLKWMTDWLVAMGVNFVQPHAFYYSIQGHRKWECPPGEFYQSSFWPYYSCLAEYAARLCSVFTEADHVADVAVLWPSRSMWSTITPRNTEQSKKVVRGFETVTTALLKAGYDFDIIPEESLLDHMSSFSLEHYVSGEQYKALVIPHVTTLLSDTADFIFECIDSGLSVVMAGEPPRNLVSESDNVWSDHDWSPEVFAEQFGVQYDAESRKLEARPVTTPNESAALIPNVLDMNADRLAEVLSDALTQLFDADVMIVEPGSDKLFIPDIVHTHYRHGDNDFYMFVNTSREQSHTAFISLDTIGVPSVWNAETGEVLALPSYDYNGERTTFRLDFAPCESYVIGVSLLPLGEDTIGFEKERKFGRIIQLSDEWQFSTQKPNVLPLSEWRFCMGTRGEGPWSGASHVYTTTFECDAELSVARLAIDGLLTEKIWRRTTPIHVAITLNGHKVEDFEQGDYIDHLIMEADILLLVKRGKNVLQIRTDTQLAPAGNLSDPAYLIGDFEVRRQGGKLRLVPAAPTITTGDWVERGYPFYSGIGVYSQTVKLPRTRKRVFLRMEHPGDMAEVVVNGEFAAVLAWEPWAADITGLVRPGDNEITIKVANSMGNIFMMEPKPSGLLGKVEIAIAK